MSIESHIILRCRRRICTSEQTTRSFSCRLTSATDTPCALPVSVIRTVDGTAAYTPVCRTATGTGINSVNMHSIQHSIRVRTQLNNVQSVGIFVGLQLPDNKMLVRITSLVRCKLPDARIAAECLDHPSLRVPRVQPCISNFVVLTWPNCSNQVLCIQLQSASCCFI